MHNWVSIIIEMHTDKNSCVSSYVNERATTLRIYKVSDFVAYGKHRREVPSKSLGF